MTGEPPAADDSPADPDAPPRITEVDIDARAGSASASISAERISALKQEAFGALATAEPVDTLAAQAAKSARSRRKLRKPVARWLMWTVSIQLVLMNASFVCVGVGWLTYQGALFEYYMGASFGALIGVVLLIAKYLFSDPPEEREPSDGLWTTIKKRLG